MNNAGLQQTRQSDPRKGSPFDHDLAGNTDELVVSGSEGRAEHERWQSRHASADVTQAGFGGGDEGDSGSPANELCVDGERACRLSGVSAGAGADRESGAEIKKFGLGLCDTK